MTRITATAKGAALSLAVLTHGALALAIVTPGQTLIEGAEGAAEVRLGSGFQDMAVGTLAPEKHTDTALAPSTADPAPVEQPEQTPPEPTSSTSPQSAPTASQPTRADVVTPEQPVLSAPARPGGTLSSAPPETVSSTAPETATQAAPEKAARAPAPERIDSTPPDSAAVTQSSRPRPRSADFVATHKPKPKPKPKQTARKAQEKAPPKGNAQQNARAGETAGKATAKARASGNAGQRQAAGNAAASNYPGVVMRKISRAGKPRVNARGAAVIAFSIGNAGGIASVSLARSSGSAALDKAAVRMVRNAGPFPKPPQGALRRFSIRIEGR